MHSFTNVELTVPITETLLELMFDDSRLCTDSKHSATPMSIESKYYTSDANGKATRIAFLISNGECIGMRTTA